MKHKQVKLHSFDNLFGTVIDSYFQESIDGTSVQMVVVETADGIITDEASNVSSILTLDDIINEMEE
jgi:hypothetical protein